MTTGYHPHQALWHFFAQRGDEKPITSEEREKIERIIRIAHGLAKESGTAAVHFANVMRESTGKELESRNIPVVEGLLQCLGPDGGYTEPSGLTLGIYDHFKGGVYRVKGFSSWASGNGEKVVEYLSMIFGTDHTRLALQWTEVVAWPDGKYRSRFVYRGPDLKVPEPSFKVPSPTTARD